MTPMLPPKLTRDGRHGSALFTALLVVAVGAVIGMTVLSAGSRASMTASRATARLDQRTLAWSAVQAVMADLGSQREQLLLGNAPTLKGEYSLWHDGTKTATAKLMPFSSASARDDAPPVAQPEGGKLDLNLADRDSLIKLAVLDEAMVDAIIARRAQHPWSSVEELASLPGIGPAELFGNGKSESNVAPRSASSALPPPPPLSFSKSAGKLGDNPIGNAGTKAADKSNNKPNDKPNDKPVQQDVVAPPVSPLPLTSVFTVHSFDPSISTVGGAKSDRSSSQTASGEARLNMLEPSTTLPASIDARCGAGASLLLKAMKDIPSETPTGTALVTAMRRAAVPAALWPAVLDELTTTGDPFVQGLIDVNAADARVLATVPGIDQTAATAIVEARQSLSASKRASVTWPLSEGILDADKFQLAAGRLTARSMQWRVRIEAGLASESNGAGSETTLRNRVVIDAVIDVADARPRLAYMRDVTLLPAALILNERFKAAAKKAADESPLPDPTPPTPPATDVFSQPQLEPAVPLAPEPPVNPAVSKDAPPAEPKPPMIHDPRTGRWTTGRKSQ